MQETEKAYLGWNIEAVSLLSVELCCVQNDGNLPLQHHEHHGVLVRARHPLRTVSLYSKQGDDIVIRPFKELFYCYMGMFIHESPSSCMPLF